MPTAYQLREKVKSAPKKPGVYFWLDKSGRVLYVGRATSLKARLSQYLQKGLDRRIAEMIALAKDVRYEITDSLLEAIILEAKNIKKYWPKYNVKDRDDRSFVYVVIPRSPYPHPTIIRGSDLKKFPAPPGRVFGPYQSLRLLQSALKLIRPIFPYSTCRPDSSRACFDYQIGLCPGICIGKIGKREYRKNIDNIILLLRGEKKKLLGKLIQENPEKARALQHLQDVSLLVREDNLKERVIRRIEGYDISHLSGRETYGSLVVFEDGVQRKDEYRLFKIREAAPGDDERALAEVLKRRFQHPEWSRPDIIMIDGGRPQIQFLSKILAQEGVAIPLIGISKFGGDRLVLADGADKALRRLAENIKPTLLMVREEAHRFANRGRKRGTKLRA